MSTIIATTLGNGVKSVPVDTVVEGSLKSWVNFNGTGTVAIRDSFNTSSITDGGTGTYAPAFTNAMPNANHNSDATSGDDSGNRTAAQVRLFTASGYGIYVLNHGNALAVDSQYNCCGTTS